MLTNVEIQPAQFNILFSDNSAQYTIRFAGGHEIPLAYLSLPFKSGGKRGTGNLEALSTRLVEQLDSLSFELDSQSGRDNRYAFWQLFSDGLRMCEEGWQGFLDHNLHINSYWSVDNLLVMAMFYKAISLFLRSGDRYIQMDAWLVYTFATWQWFNLVKCALEIRNVIKPVDGRETDGLSETIEREFAAAYSALAPILTTERFVYALRWLPVWLGKSVDQVPNGPTLRERMRLSMVLARPRSLGNTKPLDFEPRKPLDAPGCFHSGGLRWDQVRLHPMFLKPNEKDAQAEVRRLISNWLLPRYDFESAFRLSRMVRAGNREDPAWLRSVPHWFWFLEGGLAVWFFLMILVGSLIVGGQGASFGLLSDGSACDCLLYRAVTLEIVLFLLPTLLALLFLDWHTIQNFALPRVIGGVFIGYLALALQSDSIKLIFVFLRSESVFLMPFFVWVVVLVLGALYLVSDTNALVRDWQIAWKRALQTLVTVLFAAAIIGLLVVTVTTVAFPEHEVFDTAFQLPDPVAKIIDTGEKYFLGPFGWINIFQYILFVPLALFTGLVTQFIFEEQSVTASVWASEQE